jgi:hypothetical protein
MYKKELTDEEIVKALECCVKNDCEKCPYLIKGFDCVISKQTENVVLDLIYRLQDENGKQKAEIERLNKCVMSEVQVRKCCADIIQETRTQAVKDTAKEILLWLIEHTFESCIVETYFRERFGVEVE